jgi:outer membrane receptor for ferrienterochelin and colicin
VASLNFYAIALLHPVSAFAQDQQEPSEGQAEEQNAEQQGQTIIVTARKQGATNEIDRVVYDIAATADAASLSTIDVLKQLPGVIVDPSRRIRFRGGANVGFLVDGKSIRRDVALGIPASQIDRIELITNPPAQYASDFDSLINIILKTDTNLGFSGSVSGKVDTLGGGRAGVNLNHGGNVWNFAGSLTAQSDPENGNTTRQFAYRSVQPEGFDLQELATTDRQSFRQISGQVKATGNLAEGKTLSFVLGANLNLYPQSSSGTRTLSGPQLFEQRDFTRTIDFEALYPYASATYETKREDGTYFSASVEAFFGDSDENRRIFELVSQSYDEDITFNYIEANVERKGKLGNAISYLVGANFNTNSVSSDLALVGFRGPGQLQANRYRFDRQVYAAFGSLETKLLGIGIKSGLRVETIVQSVESDDVAIPADTGETFVLPSLHLAYETDSRNSLKASFTTRVEKPDALYFNPFERFVTAFQIIQGNPALEPSIKKQFEISHNFQGKNLTVDNSFYYRDTKKDFVDLLVLGDDGVTVSSYVNLGSSKTYGYSASVKSEIIKGLNLSFSVDTFIKDLFVENSGVAQQVVSYIGFNSSANLDYKIDKDNTLSANLAYTGRTTDINIVDSDTWSSEFAYTRQLPHGFSLSITAVNLFVPQDTLNRFIADEFDGFERVFRESRLVRIGIAKEF